MNIDGHVKPRIILAVKDAVRKDAYLSALAAHADCTVLERLGEIPEQLRRCAFKGILIDINLNVRANHMEKVKVSDSLKTMPSAMLNFDAGRGLIRLLMLDSGHGNILTLEEFAAVCAAFEPEILYPENREGLHLNALLSTSPAFGPDSEKTFTMYVSGSGCFFFTANTSCYRQHDTVWIDFVGLADRTPVIGKINWRCEWGVSHMAPGIYVSFESIRESQHEEIMSLLPFPD